MFKLYVQQGPGPTSDEIIKDVTSEPEENEEDRTVDTGDYGEDVDDTTPAEAEEMMDEGEKILEEERKRRGGKLS